MLIRSTPMRHAARALSALGLCMAFMPSAHALFEDAEARRAILELRQRFDTVREAVITAPRDAQALKQEIVSMRERVRSAHPVRGDWFDVKHSRGGMLDAEFVVQYLVLSQSAQHPELVANLGNIALLQRAEKAGLLPAGVGQAAASAYRELRRMQHTSRLDEGSGLVPEALVTTHRDAVLALWQAVFADQ